MKDRCPRCNSPDPARHPAMQAGGEVQPCSHPWHGPHAACPECHLPPVNCRCVDPRGFTDTAQTLWEILVITGYDTDGDTGPEALIAGMGWDGYVGVVRDEVKRLREDYDEALDEIP